MVRMPSVGLSGPTGLTSDSESTLKLSVGLALYGAIPTQTCQKTKRSFIWMRLQDRQEHFAALMALRKRDKTGVGELVELSQSENMLNHIGELFITQAELARFTNPLGNRHRVHAPQGCYPCQGDDQWAVIVVTNDDQWRQWCALMDADVGERCLNERSTAIGRQAKHDAIDERMREWTETHTPTPSLKFVNEQE